MSPFIPIWIIGGPFAGLLFLAFSFRGQSAMGGSAPRLAPRSQDGSIDLSAPLSEPMHPDAPRRIV